MPELPEIETIKLQLQKVLIGQTIVGIEQLHKKSLQGNPQKVIGKQVVAIKRFGKMLVIELSSSHPERFASLDSSPPQADQNDKLIYLAIHFKMSGQLILIQNAKINPPAGGQNDN